MGVGILEAAPQARCSQASQLQQDKPPGCISLIRLSNDLMHFLAASIKLNQVLMRLSLFRFCFGSLDALSRGDSSSQEPGEAHAYLTGRKGWDVG